MIGVVTNSVLNRKPPPIQAAVTDVEKCFDKLWLQAAINSLHEAGLSNYWLNILYIENKKANIAVKINGKLIQKYCDARIGMGWTEVHYNNGQIK